MIHLSIVAAGVIAVAAAIFTFSSDRPRTVDQSGITLQTLIVTAVLVLMAGVAAVVIIGITTGQRDRLEDAGRVRGDSNCEKWEIYDPTLASTGRGGTSATGGIYSSARGCVRVCYVDITVGTADATADLTAAEVEVTSSTLEFSRSNIQDITTADEADHVIPVMGLRSVDLAGSRTATTTPLNNIYFDHDGDSGTDEQASTHVEIRVSTDGNSCVVWDTTDDEEVFRST